MYNIQKMDPNTDKTRALNLPQPDQGQGVDAKPLSDRVSPLDQSQSAVPVHPVASWLPPTVPVQAPNPPAGRSMTSRPNVSHAPHSAEDKDIIETEWVQKAKQIMSKTKHDPYLQAKELHRFKADYMKKRYNKDIKILDE